MIAEIMVLTYLDHKQDFECKKVMLFLTNLLSHPEIFEENLKNTKLVFLPLQLQWYLRTGI